MNPEEEFWGRLDEVDAGMLGFKSAGVMLPMAPSLREEYDGNIWFITTQGVEMVTVLTLATQIAQFVVADTKSGLYATVEGKLSLEDEPDIIEELWSPVTAAWFEDERKGAALRLLRFTPESGIAWYSTTQGVQFLYDVARAKMTTTPSATGWTAKLAFAPQV